MQAGHRSVVHGGASDRARACAVVGAGICEASQFARTAGGAGRSHLLLGMLRGAISKFDGAVNATFAGRGRSVSIATTSGCQVRL